MLMNTVYVLTIKLTILLHEREEHPWIRNADQARDVFLGEHVRMRIKQFSLMNKFKKRVLRVRY